MKPLALLAGGFLLLVGGLGVLIRLFPPYDGELVLAGAVLFASGVVADALKKP